MRERVTREYGSAMRVLSRLLVPVGEEIEGQVVSPLLLLVLAPAVLSNSLRHLLHPLSSLETDQSTRQRPSLQHPVPLLLPLLLISSIVNPPLPRLQRCLDSVVYVSVTSSDL
jgi:hypothetical protein